MQYDTLNRLISYNETQQTQETQQAQITLFYNDLNQVITRNEAGTDRKGAYTIDTTDMQYNDIGQQTGFTTVSSRGLTAGTSETTTRSNTTYNSVGLALGYSETTTSQLGTQTRTLANTTYDNRGRTYGFTETGTSEDGLDYSFTRSNIQYDGKQRINSFNEQGKNYNFTRNNITYDQYNRITNYTEQGVNQGTYNLTKSIIYNNLDQVTSFTEQGSRQNSGNYTTNRSGITYDSLGRVTEFHETGTTQGNGSYSLHRYAINYKLSTINSYTETGSQEGKGTYTTERSQMQYANGLLTGFHEKTSSSDGSIIEFTRSKITYNDNQQITGYEEQGTRAGQGNYSLTRSGMQYNSLGQVTGYRETGSNWDGSYNYTRHSINYDSNGRISEYQEQGTDTKGKGYSMHRYSMQYHGNGLLYGYLESGSDGPRGATDMQYDSNGTLTRYTLTGTNDKFQFGDAVYYSFSYDGYGNQTQTRIDTPDYWVTFDGKGNQTNFGYSAAMQGYIDDLQRQAEEAEREAEMEMRSAEDKINEAIEEERRAMEEEASATVEWVETRYEKRGKKKYDVITIYHYADGSTTTETQRVKGKEKQARRKAEEARRKAEQAAGLATSKRQEAERKSREAQDRANNAKSQADRARGKAEDARRQASSRRDQASSKAQEARTKAERAKETARTKKEQITKQESKITKSTEPRIQVTRTKNSDGSTTVILTDRLTGNRRELRFDSFGDMTYKQAKNAKGEITHFETHSYTRDSSGRITSDTYRKEVVVYNNPTKPRFTDGVKQQTRDRVIESGTINYNKYGQVTGADITRTVKTEMSTAYTTGRGKEINSGWHEIGNYTMEIKLTTDQDSQGRVTAEHETTHIFGKEGVQQKNGSWKSQDVDYTINRDRTYSYDGNSVLPSGWHERVTQSNMDLVIETDIWDIKYDDKGRMQDYRGKTHEYGSYVDAKGKTQTLDVTREFHRYDIAYNDKNQMTSYREDRWSSDKPGLIQQAYVYDIQYNAAGLMESYIEQLREVGYVALEGVPKGLAPPSFGLEETMQVIAELASGKSDLLSQYYLIDKTTITHRQNIKYNGLNQITGYTDTITNPDQTTTTVTMTGITYWADGRMKGYSQTTTGPDDEGKIKTHTTNIYSTEYDRLGRIDEKYGTYDGKAYKWQAISYDELGRPTAYKEKYGKVSYRHYDIQYNELGDVAYEKVKVTAKSGGLIKSKTTVVTEYKYGYDEYGQHEKTWENEIYRKTTKSFFGKLLDVVGFVLQVVSIFVPGLQWAVFAFNAVKSILEGNIMGLVLQIAGQIAGAVLGGIFSGATQGEFLGAFKNIFSIGGQGFDVSNFTKFLQVFQAIDGLVGDLTGKSLSERLFGENAGLFSAILSAFGSLFSSGIQGVNSYRLLAFIAKISFAAIIQNNKDRLGQWSIFLQALVNQAFDTWANISTRHADLEAQGFKLVRDETTGKQLWKKDDISGTTYLNDDNSLNRLEIKDKHGNITEILYPSKEVEGGLDHYTADGKTFLYTTAINPTGGMDYYDQNGVKRLSLYSTGWTEVFDSVGKSYALIPPNAEIVWNSDGIIKESFIDYDGYTEYYSRDGSLNGRIVDGYTALKRGDEIVGQTRNISDDTYIYRDASGRFVNKVTITADGGILANNGQQTTYFSNSNTPVWMRANYEHSDIYFYDSAGQNIIEILSTQLDQSGLVKGYLYTDTLTGNITKYDAEANYQGTYLARKDAQDNIIGYQGTDKEGNFVVLDRRQDILYKIDDKGTYILYDIDPSKPYLVLNPDAVHIVETNGEIRFVLGFDPQTDKYVLYDALGTKITDNPAIIALKLNFTLLTMPAEIRNDIWTQALVFIMDVTEQMKRDLNPLYITQDDNERSKLRIVVDFFKDIFGPDMKAKSDAIVTMHLVTGLPISYVREHFNELTSDLQDQPTISEFLTKMAILSTIAFGSEYIVGLLSATEGVTVKVLSDITLRLGMKASTVGSLAKAYLVNTLSRGTAYLVARAAIPKVATGALLKGLLSAYITSLDPDATTTDILNSFDLGLALGIVGNPLVDRSTPFTKRILADTFVGAGKQLGIQMWRVASKDGDFFSSENPANSPFNLSNYKWINIGAGGVTEITGDLIGLNFKDAKEIVSPFIIEPLKQMINLIAVTWERVYREASLDLSRR